MSARRKWREGYRNPKTTNERRAYYDFEDDSRRNKNNPYVRAKRNPRRLANAYDDISYNYDSSWKARRANRYHEKGWQWHTVRFIEWANNYTSAHYKFMNEIKRRGYFYDVDYERVYTDGIVNVRYGWIYDPCLGQERYQELPKPRPTKMKVLDYTIITVRWFGKYMGTPKGTI